MEERYQEQQAPIMKVGDWIIVFLITAIPIVNIIMLFVWGFGDGHNPNKSNWAKASLIMMAIVFVIYIFIALIVGGVMLFRH